MADIEINGAMSEGGGQILRTALTLSMATGKSMVIDNVRAGRRKPGLLRQHLAAVRAAQRVSNGQTEGAELGSTRLAFRPGPICGGTYEFRIGSAGSTTLVVQTVLPVLALADVPSTVVVHGGTHNGMAPSVDFCERTLLPVLGQMGLQTRSELLSYGFAPNGGGCWRIRIQPWSQVRPLALCERGEPVSRRAVAVVGNLRSHIPQRELERVMKRLGWSESEVAIESVESAGPGNILSLRCDYEAIAETFESVGAVGVSAERVAGRAIRDARRYLHGGWAVGEHLADQLLLPMVLGAGGEFSTGAPSEHCVTNMTLIDQWLQTSNFDVESSASGDRTTIRIPNGLALARRLEGDPDGSVCDARS